MAEMKEKKVSGGTDSPAWVAALPAAQSAEQLLIVACDGMEKSSAVVSMHRRDENGAWKEILRTPACVGRKGLCADRDHREGCAQTPVGVYRFNKAFGIAPDPGCALGYIQVDENTCWSGDPQRRYNKMVDLREVPDLEMAHSERLAQMDPEYRYCLSISFNEEGIPGRGSAIFLHCAGEGKTGTAGCVAIPEDRMAEVMRRVREYCVAVIDTMENLDRKNCLRKGGENT